MGRKQYTDEEIAAALMKLAFNKGNYNKTSKETGIPPMTLHRWQNNATPTSISEGVGEKIESVVLHLLDNIPQNLTGRDWGVALGILLDKYMTMNGGVNSRVETFSHTSDEKPVEENKRLNDKEFFEKINNANKAVERLSGK